jgi:3-dehydroquinate synthase
LRKHFLEFRFMKTLQVELGARSYPIHIGPDLLTHPELVQPHVHGRQVLIVTNEVVAPLYLDRAIQLFAGFEVEALVLPDGEETKSLQTAELIFTRLLQLRFDRKCTLVALGGGVIGDLTGFAAATYQRGVNFIQIPTTLLAQVDSSVGGKTGVNHPLGKNMIGAFYQPQCVLADTETLNTLDPRQLAAGVAEVIKYGLIRDPVFLVWIEQHIDAINARDPAALSEAIERSCQNKAEVVAADEHEANQRALLNLGHTFGHAIESGMGYGVWLHGEAVAAGMVMAADLSQRMGWIGDTDVARARDLIARGKLPVIGPKDLDKDRYLELMAVDKKVEAGQIRLVLLHALGEAVLTADYDPVLLQQTLDAYRGTRNEPV